MARAWFEKAADRGNAKAMHNVGVYLAQGIQGKPDYATAVTWFKKAADRNVRDSQFNLAILMARGLGTARDFKASYFWFAVAARGRRRRQRQETRRDRHAAHDRRARRRQGDRRQLEADRARSVGERSRHQGHQMGSRPRYGSREDEQALGRDVSGPAVMAIGRPLPMLSWPRRNCPWLRGARSRARHRSARHAAPGACPPASSRTSRPGTGGRPSRRCRRG